MLKKILFSLAFVLALVISIALIRTLTIKSKQPLVNRIIANPQSDGSGIIHLQQAIRFKTISTIDSLPADTAAFIAWQKFLAQTYPLVFSKLQLKKINELGLLF